VVLQVLAVEKYLPREFPEGLYCHGEERLIHDGVESLTVANAAQRQPRNGAISM
jgi:hypothetical protein